MNLMMVVIHILCYYADKDYLKIVIAYLVSQINDLTIFNVIIIIIIITLQLVSQLV